MVGCQGSGEAWALFVTSNVSLIWAQSLSIVFLVVGKSAIRVVTSLLWDMRKGYVLWGESHAGCRTSSVAMMWCVDSCGDMSWCALCRLMHGVVRGDDVLMYITCRLTPRGSKCGFPSRNVGKLRWASICCVKEKMRKCLKISVKTLQFQIFFVYLPAFMRVMPSRTRSRRWVKYLKVSDLECNKAEINNF